MPPGLLSTLPTICVVVSLSSTQGVIAESLVPGLLCFPGC